jgi:hypothetical protein
MRKEMFQYTNIIESMIKIIKLQHFMNFWKANHKREIFLSTEHKFAINYITSDI